MTLNLTLRLWVNLQTYIEWLKLVKKVFCLLSDSTNAEIPAFNKSERIIGDSIIKIVEKIEGRIIFASFASNIFRLQQAADVAVATGRKIAVFGRSMENAIVNGQKLGYIKVPKRYPY